MSLTWKLHEIRNIFELSDWPCQTLMQSMTISTIPILIVLHFITTGICSESHRNENGLPKYAFCRMRAAESWKYTRKTRARNSWETTRTKFYFRTKVKMLKFNNSIFMRRPTTANCRPYCSPHSQDSNFIECDSSSTDSHFSFVVIEIFSLLRFRRISMFCHFGMRNIFDFVFLALAFVRATHSRNKKHVRMTLPAHLCKWVLFSFRFFHRRMLIRFHCMLSPTDIFIITFSYWLVGNDSADN